MALAVMMIAGLFVLPVSAVELTSVPADAEFKYLGANSEDALMTFLTNGAELLYTYGTGEGKVGLGTQIGASDWRLRNANESSNGIGNSEDDIPITFGITHNGRLFITPRTATLVRGVDVKYTTDEAAKIPALVLTKDLTGLSSNHRISTEILKVADSRITPGIRFMTHNNGQNYYAFILPGNSVEAAYDVQLVKSVDGNVTSVATFGDGTSYKGMYAAWLSFEIIINNGTIRFNANGNGKKLSGVYTDEEAFNVSGNDAGVWLMGTNGGNNPERKIQFRNFAIQNYSPFVDYAPENIMCIDASEGKDADEEGVINFGKAVPVRKLLYSGKAEDKNILVSNDKFNWYILANTSQFESGVWVNDITSTPYRYVKTEGITDDITFLTEVYEITTEFTGDPITLYPRIKHKDAFGTATITSDSNAVSVNGMVITPSSEGTATVTATYKVDGTDYSISIPVTVGKPGFSYSDNISDAATQTLTGLGKQIVGTNWRMRNATETPDGLATYTDGSAAKYGINANGMYIDTMFNSVQRYNTDVAKTIPALVLTQDLTGLTRDQKISFDVYKYHGTGTVGVRFMVHNGGKNYYALIIGSNNYNNADKRWELQKVVDGVVSDTALVFENNNPMADTSGKFWNVTIETQGNNISFTATDTTDPSKTFGGSYEDAAMFDVSGNDSGVWLMGMNGNNNNTRYIAFKNFEIENNIPYLNGKEPAKVVYMDVAEGKTVDSNGIIDLGAHWVIRRVEAEGAGEVFISEDNQRWFSIGNLEDGKVFNTLTVKEMRYVKVEGATDVKVLTEVSGNKFDLVVGDEVTLYPYFNGEIPADVTITSNSSSVKVVGKKITAVTSGQGIKITVASETAADSIEIDVESSLGDVSEFTYTVNTEDETKWDFNIEAPRIKDVNYPVIIAFYDADDCLKSAQVFKEVEFDVRGKASFTADKTDLEAGDYALGYIWNNLDEGKPVMNVSEVNEAISQN